MSDLKDTMQRVYDEVFSGGNIDLIDELLHEDFIEHEELPPGIPQGRGAPKAYTTMFRSAFPDLKATVVEMLQDGDKVITRSRWTGTHEGDFMGIPPTGRSFDMSAIDIVEFKDGKGIGHWGITDIAGMMEQLGIAGPPE